MATTTNYNSSPLEGGEGREGRRNGSNHHNWIPNYTSVVQVLSLHSFLDTSSVANTFISYVLFYSYVSSFTLLEKKGGGAI